MRNIVFVHGTGVRQPSYDNSFTVIEQQSSSIRAGGRLDRCYWGGTEGSKLGSEGASIPDFDTTRAVNEVSPEDLEVESWRLLYEDPDSELEASFGQPVAARSFNPNEEPPLETVSRILEKETEETRTCERALGVDGVWLQAKSRVLDTVAASVKAKRTLPEIDSPFRKTLARALVAHAMNLAFGLPEDGREWPTGEPRDALVSALCKAWGGDDRAAVFGWIGSRVKRLALKIGTNKIARKRGAISDAAYPATGDILLYQARGVGIRNFIEAAVQKAPKPCILLAHSLGGIACVDLLAEKRIEGVELLVTAGSQAPLLFELNALSSLPYGTSLPEGFPKWLNLYDKHDFLSYIGAGVFPGRVKDVLVDNKQPFPEAHGAYWKNPKVWQAVAESLP